jgi:uroporphyrinogen decarboxylase
MTQMTGRERVLTALNGDRPDRVPCALNFYRVNLAALAPPDYVCNDCIDANFIRFPASPEEEAFRQAARPFSPDTRLGTFTQIANYDRWRYRPEYIPQRNPLARAQSIDDLRAFPFPDATSPLPIADLRAQVDTLHAQGLAAGGNLPHLGGELFEAAWRLRGLEAFLLDLIERPDWAHFLLDRLTDLACRNAEALAQADIDVMGLGDDVGMPGAMMIGPKTWRTFFKPRMARMVRAARAIKPDIRVLFHSDGYFAPLIPDLLDIGVNAITIQPDHMDAVRIRQQYDSQLAFWGTIGYQTTFSYARPEAIRAEVKTRIETLGRAGLVLAPAYDIDEPDIPWENIAAFLNAARSYG